MLALLFALLLGGAGPVASVTRPADAAQPATSSASRTTARPSDRRNVDVPDTDTHVALGAFDTADAWMAHRARVRQQILASAGLDPLPERTP